VKFYAVQKKNYGLGNFVMMTPAIQVFHNHIKDRVPVIFHHGFIRQMYEKWDAIRIVEKRKRDNHLNNPNTPLVRKISWPKGCRDKITTAVFGFDDESRS